jgi:PAS domain S-box-containing protein
VSAANECFQTLADGAPVMIWMSGLDLGCIYFNRAWLEYRGRTVEQESGNGWAEGVHPDDVERCVNHYISCFERRLSFAMSYRLQNAAGEYHWILDRGAPHHDLDGEFLGFYGGCAVLERDTAATRNAELRHSLASMQGFAQKIAMELDAPPNPAAPPADLTHPALISLEQRVAQLRHAAHEMTRLANDMVVYGRIARGACLT